MSFGFKHLVTCRCVLPQFKRLKPEPPRHQFVVFSIINDDDSIKQKFAQCNNCGVIHKVTGICLSTIMIGKEDMKSIITIDDIRLSLPQQLANILDANDVDLATWEASQFFYENKDWSAFVVLNTDEEDGLRQGKYLRILGENLFKIEAFEREEVIK